MITDIEKFQDVIFKDVSLLPATFREEDVKMKRVYELVATKMLDHPINNTKYFQNHFRKLYAEQFLTEPSKFLCVRHCDNIRIIIGNVKQHSKDFIRYMFNEMIMNTIRKADAIDDLNAMNKALSTLAKYNRLDQIDTEAIDYEKIYVQPFEPTDDPSVIGLKPIPGLREKIAKLKEKYRLDDITDIQVIESNE